ncbi:hypothetical protein D5S17_28890 [Pseudonocardiaceae bacterium YIM PH 21723]|nr:hypothetical protein D5S17_28890 [Pseudonocardiaceae bacterium YIM PH 21723]
MPSTAQEIQAGAQLYGDLRALRSAAEVYADDGRHPENVVVALKNVARVCQGLLAAGWRPTLLENRPSVADLAIEVTNLITVPELTIWKVRPPETKGEKARYRPSLITLASQLEPVCALLKPPSDVPPASTGGDAAQ